MFKKFGIRAELNPGQVLVLGFAAVILIGAILLDLPISAVDGKSSGFLNCIFTATSAVCVTGLVVYDTGTHWTLFGKTVIMLLIQVGGLGFMTMTTMIAVFMGKKISLRNRLIMQEALNQFTVAGIVRMTKTVLTVTLAIEGIGALLLMVRFIPEHGFLRGVYYSVFHSVSAFCNAGFDIIGNFRGLTPYVKDPIINFTIMGLIVLGGLGFAVMSEVVTVKQIRKMSLHVKVVLAMTAFLIASGAILIFIVEYSNPNTLGPLNIFEKIQAALFQAVTPRTAGFNTVDMSMYTISAQLMTIILMFIGGSPGSTAGGIKTTTFGIIIAHVYSVIIGREETEIFKRRIPIETISKSLALFTVALGIVLSVTMLLSFTEKGADFMTLLFETTSAFGTVGLSLNFSPKLSEIGKAIISMTMFAGRLGPLTLVMALTYRQTKKTTIKYPEGRINVG